MLRSFLFLALVALLGTSPQPSYAGSVDTASKYVEGLGNSALETISNTKLSKEKKQAKLEKLFSDNVDIPWVGRFVMGRAWKQATDEQKARYLKEYERFLIQHYASRFSEYSSGAFKITGAREDAEGEYIVNMQITTGEAGSEPVLLDYRVHTAGGRMRVFDIVVEGVSMITTQRSEFSSIVNNEGVDALTDKLASRSISAGVITPKK